MFEGYLLLSTRAQQSWDEMLLGLRTIWFVPQRGQHSEPLLVLVILLHSLEVDCSGVLICYNNRTPVSPEMSLKLPMSRSWWLPSSVDSASWSIECGVVQMEKRRECSR